jgi:CRISPR/Cas system CSM-associated protein Csm2 small subunit
MKSDRQIIFDQAVTISDQAQKITWLEEQLEINDDKIRALYDIIERHERELRGYREEARINRAALNHEAATNRN